MHCEIEPSFVWLETSSPIGYWRLCIARFANVKSNGLNENSVKLRLKGKVSAARSCFASLERLVFVCGEMFRVAFGRTCSCIASRMEGI